MYMDKVDININRVKDRLAKLSNLGKKRIAA